MSDDKTTKEAKAHETRGAREITPPKEQPKQLPSENKDQKR